MGKSVVEAAFDGVLVDEAREQLRCALDTLGNGNFPLASWRVYSAAADVHLACGEANKAAEYECRCEEVLTGLTGQFAADDPLHTALLTAIETRRAVAPVRDL